MIANLLHFIADIFIKFIFINFDSEIYLVISHCRGALAFFSMQEKDLTELNLKSAREEKVTLILFYIIHTSRHC